MALGLGHAPQRAIGYEDGKNMRNFLDLVEIHFVERGLEARQWGEELKRYLTGDALGYWLYLRRTGVPLTDWAHLRQQFCARFCNITKERMKVMIAEKRGIGSTRPVVPTGPNSIPVSPDWSKKLLGREVQVNAEGQEMGKNQQPLAVQSHAGTTLLIEEGHTRKRDHSSELDGDAAEGDCPRDTNRATVMARAQGAGRHHSPGDSV
ncbi:LOW QUALITY PROTEIN: uncharacterized protein EMH_0024440 [Eimeria mitis]|uniref:Retrotransposon gag domain-containing protein n=1 Tax=Eimeria mitis TaxID=44415 RepID=U6KAY2_9EIME|nr:LOW QUALITY PROTEIN: uncharacterized protein EMH_0024440 [Eimeria mitis]CDJ35190.1 hypothetical protein EMH_0024440 [Eimeria mitis]